MIGQLISHYRVISKIGQGGMGEVYLAEDTRLGRKVALKFLSPMLAGQREFMVRFRNEARAAAELSHANIATIHDIGEFDGRPFMVFEFLEGQSLSERIAEGPLPVDEVLKIGRALASGLTEAHSRGIVHRDIKSANIMLTAKGEVKILDFGLAHHRDATQLTLPGSTLGTVSYMSPEQARGETVGERSDLWSLGVVLYECLTGRLPFQGPPAAVIEQIKSVDPSPPTALRTGVPLELEQTVLRCLDKDQELRYQHADDLVATLRSLELNLSGSGAGASALSGSSQRFSRGVRASLLVMGVLSVVAVAIWRPWAGPESSFVGSDREPAVAVVDFGDLTKFPEARSAEMLTQLVQTSLVQTSPCRVISLEYLKDLRRRRFGAVSGEIGASEALQLAREADATVMVTGSVLDGPDGQVVTWRMVDCSDAEDMDAGRVTAPNILSLADSTTNGIVARLQTFCGVEMTPAESSVSRQSTASPEAYAFYIQALDARRDGEDDRARDLFVSAVAADSSFALAWFELARCQPQRSRLQDRRREYTENAWSLQSRLSVKDLLRLQAWRARERYDVDTGFSAYEELLRRWPEDLLILFDYANDLSQLWYAPRALEIAEQALKLYPGESRFWQIRLKSLIALDRITEATQVLEEAVAAGVPEIITGAWATDLALERGDFASAARAFERWSAIEPDQVFVLWTELRILYAQGDLSGALARSTRAMEDSGPASYVSSNLMGYWRPGGPVGVAAERGQFRAAWVLQEERFATHYPGVDVRGSQLGLARMLGTAQDVDRFLGWMQSEPRPLLPGDRRSAAIAWAMIDSFERSEESIAAFYRTDRIFGFTALRARAIRAVSEGRGADAVSMLDGFAKEGLPHWGYLQLAFRELRARALAGAGRLDDSLAEWQRIRVLYGGRLVARYELALVLEELGRVDEARAEYEGFLADWPDADSDRPQLLDARARLAALDSAAD